MRASLARQVKFSFNIIQFLYIFKCGLHWLDRLSFQLFNTIQFFIYIEMRASLARQVKFSIVQYNSVFYIFKCGLHWLDRFKFSIVQYNSVFYIYLNAGFTGSTC